MQKIIDELISSFTEGVDVYRWKDSTWLIFTNETRWVVELTDEGTLWYNYKFFKEVFRYVSITVGTEMDGYIIQWANDFFYKDCAHRAAVYPHLTHLTQTSNVIENGIKDTQGRGKNHGDEFEWHTRAVIDNGVKEVGGLNSKAEFNVRNVMNYGVKEVNDSSAVHRQNRAQNEMSRMIKEVKPNRVTIVNEKMDRFYYDNDCTANNTEIFRIVEEGVKEVKPNIEYSQQSGVFHPDCAANHVKIEKVIEEGVKEIKSSVWTTKRGIEISDLMCSGNTTDISSIVKNGVKNIYPDKDPDVYDWSDEFKADNVIQGGIKVIPLPTIKDFRGYSDYYNTKEDRTKPHTEYVKDAIERGVKL
jgi:hypothetical protein